MGKRSHDQSNNTESTSTSTSTIAVAKPSVPISARTILISAPRIKNNSLRIIDAKSTLTHIDQQLADQRAKAKAAKQQRRAQLDLTATAGIGSSSIDPLKYRVSAKEVLALGSTGLAHRDLKQHQKNKLVELGAPKLPGLKTPLPILRGIRAKNEMRLARKQQRDRDSGLVVKKQKKSNDGDEFTSNPTHSNAGTNSSIDHRDRGSGILSFNKHQISKVNRSNSTKNIRKMMK